MALTTGEHNVKITWEVALPFFLYHRDFCFQFLLSGSDFESRPLVVYRHHFLVCIISSSGIHVDIIIVLFPGSGRQQNLVLVVMCKFA